MLKKMFTYLEMVSIGASAAFIFGAVDKGSSVMIAGAFISIIYGLVFIVIQSLLARASKGKGDK